MRSYKYKFNLRIKKDFNRKGRRETQRTARHLFPRPRGEPKKKNVGLGETLRSKR